MMLLAISVGVLAAFAAPAAQGQLLYETPTGPLGEHNALPVGAEVTATSKNLVTTVTATGGKLECSLVTIHGIVLENTVTRSRIGETETTVEGCNNTITNQTAGEITLEGAGAGVATGATFVSDVPITCDFAGNIPFSYVTNSDTLKVEPDPVTKDQLFGNCGHAIMTGSFTLETSDETPVDIT